MLVAIHSSPGEHTMRKRIERTYAGIVALALIVVGAINWGLIGLAHFLTDGGNWNVVEQIFGGTATLEFGIYLLVGLAGLVVLGMAVRDYAVDRSERLAEPEPMEGKPQA